MVVQTFFKTVKKFVIKVLNIIIHLYRTQNQCAICEFVIYEFVITVKFCKDMLRIFTGTQKNFTISEISLYLCFTCTKQVLLYYFQFRSIYCNCMTSAMNLKRDINWFSIGIKFMLVFFKFLNF